MSRQLLGAQANSPGKNSSLGMLRANGSSRTNMRSGLEVSPGNHVSLQTQGVKLQPKLTVGMAGDRFEKEAEHVAEQVMRMPTDLSASASGIEHAGTSGILQRKCACGGAAADGQECDECREKSSLIQRSAENSGPVSHGGTTAPPIVRDVLRSPGTPLDSATRAFMEPRFGQDFSGVRVHGDSQAAASARAINARAYTVGRNIVFGTGEYNPVTPEGKQLIAHELVHTLQQKAPSSEPVIQRDLLAYKTQHTEFLPSTPDSGAVVYQEYTADAGTILTALDSLIKSKKLTYRDETDKVTISNISAGRSELVAAFSAAKFAKAAEMSDALLDDHNISVYSENKISKVATAVGTMEAGSQEQNVERQARRPLTAIEKSEARLAFGSSLNFDPIVLEEDPVMAAGNFARTTPFTINFPPGAFSNPNFMFWLIHELTHAWQYQHGVSVVKTGWYAMTTWIGINTYDYEKEKGLLEAQKAGKKFTDFNTEQQGDIVRDYYYRLKSGLNTAAWQPFVTQVQGTL